MANGPSCPVTKLDKLLLATDGTPYSEGAVREGIKFAAKCASRVYACMTIETNPEYETIGASAMVKEEEEAAAHLKTIKVRAEKEGLVCETIFHESRDAWRAIVDDAADKSIDMIVVGRRGYKGLAKALMGETAAKVIGHAPCKVLVVPRAAQIECRNILVATDGSAHGNAAVSEAITIAKRCGSHVIALSTWHDDRDREEARSLADRTVEMARNEGVSAEALTPAGRSHDAIVETAGGRSVDLIVMGAYGKTGVKKLLMGSSTEKVIGRAGCAVLVAKA